MKAAFLLIFSILTVITTYFSLKRKFTYVVILAIIVKIMIPFYVKIGGISISTIIFLLIFILYISQKFTLTKKLKKVKITFLTKQILTLTTALSVITLFTTSPISNLSLTLKDCISNFVLAIIIDNELKDRNSISKVSLSLLVVCLIVSIYGIHNYLTNSNPYITTLSIIYPEQRFYTYDEERFGFSSRVQSTLFHTITFGAYMMIMAIFSFYLHLKQKKKKLVYLTLTCLFCLTGFMTGSRSVLLLFLFGMLFYFIFSSLNKKVYIVLVGISGIILISSYSDSFTNYILSSIAFWDDSYAKNSDVGGSSATLRIKQLNAVIRSVPDYRILTGLGQTYFETNIKDNDIKGAESIIFRIYLDYGLLGLFFWGIFLTKILYFNYLMFRKNKNEYLILLNSLTIGFIVFSLATGFMDTIFMFSVVYTILFKYYQLEKDGCLNYNRKLQYKRIH